MKHLRCIALQSMQQLVDFLSADGPVPPLESVHIRGVDEEKQPLEVDEETAPLLLKLQSLRSVLLKFMIHDPTPLIPLLATTSTHSG
jgi:hypothetical protein